MNQVYKIVDNAFNDALKKYKPTTYEVFLVIACLKYKLYTVETKGFFHEELMQVIQESQEQMKGVVNLDPKDIYK